MALVRMWLPAALMYDGKVVNLKFCFGIFFPDSCYTMAHDRGCDGVVHFNIQHSIFQSHDCKSFHESRCDSVSVSSVCCMRNRLCAVLGFTRFSLRTSVVSAHITDALMAQVASERAELGSKKTMAGLFYEKPGTLPSYPFLVQVRLYLRLKRFFCEREIMRTGN